MRRYLVVLLALGLAAGALAPAQAAKKKKPKPKPPAPVAVPVDVTYHVVWSEETCALSTSATLASPDNSCGDPYGGPILGPTEQGTGEPTAVAAVDGLPLTFDAAKPIKGKLQMASYMLAAVPDEVPLSLGTGEAEFHVVLEGTSGGEEVVLGEATTTAYNVTPDKPRYEIEFEITPAAASAGKVFEALTFTFEATGNSVFHGALVTEGSSITLGAFAVPE